MATLLQELKTSEAANDEVQAKLRDVLTQLAELRARVAGLENLAASTETNRVPQAGSSSEPAPPSQPAAITQPVVSSGIAEEEVLAMSAAIAAWLGVQAHIRQIRLIRSSAWAQQGRATIQASHRLH
jgi:methylmalonyl-CoA carboxyltransferase large subunit